MRGPHSSSSPPRSKALTQFSRCPVTASEYLTHPGTKTGPFVMTKAKFRDFRTDPSAGGAVGDWECVWKGWQWGKFHDLALMGYSLRVDSWRYSVWLPWDTDSAQGVWTYPPFAEVDMIITF